MAFEVGLLGHVMCEPCAGFIFVPGRGAQAVPVNRRSGGRSGLPLRPNRERHCNRQYGHQKESTDEMSEHRNPRPMRNFRSSNLICEKDPIRENYTSELQLGKIVSKTGGRLVIVFGKGTASSRAIRAIA